MTPLTPITPPAQMSGAQIAQIVALAMRIANRSAIDIVQRHGASLMHADANGTLLTWHDVRPLFDAQRHGSNAVCDHGEAVTYLLDAGLAVRHPEDPLYLRLIRHA